MTRQTIRSLGRASLGGVLVAAAILVTTAPAIAQYYVPLRYDLRFGRPVYVPGREPFRGRRYQNFGNYDAPRPDPYSYEAVQSRNLFLTGNVRAGKGFQGTTPYPQTGSQFSETLPSLRLSEFRRDSVALEDLGSGIEFGAPLPYIPPSAGVTTPFDVRTQSAPAYRGPTSALPPLPPAAGYGGSGSFITPAPEPDAEPRGEPGFYLSPLGDVLPTDGDVQIPQGVYEFILRMAAERVARDEGLQPGPDAAGPADAGPDDDPAGPYLARPSFRFEEEPQNVYRPGDHLERLRAEAGEETEPTLRVRPEDIPDAEPSEEDGEEEAGLLSVTGSANRLEPDLSRPTTRYAGLVRDAHEAFGSGHYDKAAEYYREATILRPDRPTPAFGRVHALLAAGRYHQAALALEQAFARNPAWAGQPPNLLAVFPREDIYPRIVRDLKASLAPVGTDRRLNLVLGYVLYATGKADEAVPYLERAAAEGEGRTVEAAPKALLDAVAKGAG